MKFKDYKQGDIIGNWELVELIENGKYVKWLCRCRCGNLKRLYLHNASRAGSSCGCLNTKYTCDRDSGTSEYRRLYNIFRGMLARCYNKNRIAYPRYGGRGISVKFKDYTDFKQWALSNGYAPNKTIDRIDANGNYEPTNCRWVLPVEQSYNRTSNKLLNQVKIKDLVEEFDNTIVGDKMKLAKKYNCSYSAIKNIITNYKKGKYNENHEFWA